MADDVTPGPHEFSAAQEKRMRKSWGNQPAGAPMPINVEGAAANVRSGVASGGALKDDPSGGVKFDLSGDWKAR